MPQRKDDVDRQFCLARVAAGINWANKPVDKDNWKYLALCYAGWAARLYVERHEPENLGHLLGGYPEGRSLHAAVTMEEDLWNTFFEAVGRFSRSAGRFVLVAEGLRGQAEIAALGQLPWSAVIDLDPESESKGLHHFAAPILQCQRGVHLFVDSAPPPSSLERGCAWMLAGGRLSEKKTPQPLNQWVTNTLPRIRALLQKVHQETTPTPLFVIVLPGASQDPQTPMERLTRIADAAFEASKGESQVIVLGQSDLASGLAHRLIPLQVRAFVQRLHAMYGTSTAHLEAAVPGSHGWTIIPIDKLRAMQEGLLVLHSRALDDEPEALARRTSEEFWRGNPPTLHDLAGDVDLPRDVHSDLEEALREPLEAHNNHTVVFYHQPGAGGTTAAMRALWDLRTEYPTAVIRNWSPAVVDRIQSLFLLAEKPVLLAAEASVLPEAEREDLHRNLRDRNCRAVLLYLRRVLKEPEKNALGLVREMKGDEPERFCRAYESLTDDPRRQDDLRRITHDSSFIRYRSPFFYGLITFERDYTGIDRYVEEHLRDLRDKPRTLIKYLALCTIYSNGGIPEPVCKRLRGQQADSQLSLEELLGPGPARLVTSRAGQWRLLHQVLAEEVLSRIMGSDWKLDLVDIASDLIRDLRACTDPHSEQVNEMLRELFVDRQGGGDDAEDRGGFSPLITEVTDRFASPEPGKLILASLTENYPHNAHFWNHLGRFQVYEVKSDLAEAERCLEEAVKLSPDDRIHHTTLGIVRRARVRELLDQGLNRGQGSSAQELLEMTQAHFSGAATAFEKARNLASEDRYGYICHIQMIIWVANALKRALGIESIGDLGDDQRNAADWLAEHIDIAESLLNDARRLYGALDRSRDFLKQCEAGLSQLYGDFDAVIRIWEIADTRGYGSARSRRAIAHAYLARGKRQWRQLSPPELQRIAGLMNENLRGASRVEEDYRLWFEASLLLPKFDYDRAIANLCAWSQRWTSWRSHYYLYILYFLRWFAGRTNSLAEFEESLENCSNLVIGRKHSSEQWMAIAPSWCPLISSLDLGLWDPVREFWPNEQQLRRVNGIIKKIDGPQAGEIQIDGRAHIFFVPGGKRHEKSENPSSRRRHIFERNKDEEMGVNFFLGFSPVGLRAWMVEPGHVEGGDRGVETEPSEEYRPIALAAQLLPEDVIKTRVAKLHHETLLRFAYDLVKARADLEIRLSLDELRARVEAAFGIDNLFSQQRLGISNFEKLLVDSGDFEVVEQGHERIVRPIVLEKSPNIADRPRYSMSAIRQTGWVKWYDAKAGRGEIGTLSGQSFRFTRQNVESPSRAELEQHRPKDRIVEFAEGATSGIAIGVRVLPADFTLYEGKLLKPEQLRPLVEEETLSRVRKAADASEGIPLKKLQEEMERKFPGSMWLWMRFGFESFAKFVRALPNLSVVGDWPDLVVCLARKPGFGSVRPSSKTKLLPHGKADDLAAKASALEQRISKYPPYPHSQKARNQPPAPKAVPAASPRIAEASSTVKPAEPTARRKSATGSPANLGIVISRQAAQEIIRRVVFEAVGRGRQSISLADLGNLCRNKLDAGALFPRSSLSQLVKAIPELELRGEGSMQFVVLRPRAVDS